MVALTRRREDALFLEIFLVEFFSLLHICGKNRSGGNNLDCGGSDHREAEMRFSSSNVHLTLPFCGRSRSTVCNVLVTAWRKISQSLARRIAPSCLLLQALGVWTSARPPTKTSLVVQAQSPKALRSILPPLVHRRPTRTSQINDGIPLIRLLGMQTSRWIPPMRPIILQTMLRLPASLPPPILPFLTIQIVE